jgi:Fe-S-cluster containining protein
MSPQTAARNPAREHRTARNATSPATMSHQDVADDRRLTIGSVSRTLSGIAETACDRRRKKAMTDVPCTGCTACCHCVVMLHPALGDDPSQYETQTIDGVGMALKRKPDGSCIYLRAFGCSIWPRTPALCRAFDCRRYAASNWASKDPLRDERIIAAGLARSDERHL